MEKVKNESSFGSTAEELEELLYARILRRLAAATSDVGYVVDQAQGVVKSVATSAVANAEWAISHVAPALGTAGAAAQSGASDAIYGVGSLVGHAINKISEIPGAISEAVGYGAQPKPDVDTVALSKQVVRSRGTGGMPVVQILFRAPDVLRDDLKRLAIDEKRPMDELLTEAALNLLLKYQRPSAEIFLRSPKPSVDEVAAGGAG